MLNFYIRSERDQFQLLKCYKYIRKFLPADNPVRQNTQSVTDDAVGFPFKDASHGCPILILTK